MDAERIRLKVCCVASEDEASTAVRYGADAIGLVGDPLRGPGSIPDELIAQIALAVPPSVATFLITRETSVEALVDHARRTATSALQLAGWVESSVHRTLRAELLGVKLVQVLHVEDDHVLDQAQMAAASVDALLLHSGRADDGRQEPGDADRTYEWKLSRQLVDQSPVPVFLAGGLNADNVGEAIARVRPFGVDVCRGVRTFDDLNAGKLRAFVSAVNAAPRL